jgi:hypothetical protein
MAAASEWSIGHIETPIGRPAEHVQIAERLQLGKVGVLLSSPFGAPDDERGQAETRKGHGRGFWTTLNRKFAPKLSAC